jgi:hypothetical protein
VWEETEPTMRSVPVVVAYVDGQETIEVMTADDQRVAKALAANGAHPTFGVGVGLTRRLHPISRVRHSGSG